MTKSRDAQPPFERSPTGTPLDCSEDLYRFHVETADVDVTPEQVMRKHLGPRHAKLLQRLPHGFEFVAPVQCARDIAGGG